MPRNETAQYGNGPAMRGELSPRFVTGGKTYRRRAFEAYGFACMQCGKTGAGRQIDVHHRDENRDNNELSNLVVLCRGCHLRTHRSRK